MIINAKSGQYRPPPVPIINHSSSIITLVDNIEYVNDRFKYYLIW